MAPGTDDGFEPVQRRVVFAPQQGISAQVIGEDSNFTMYCYQYISEYAGATQLWRCKIATVISGIKTSRGFRDCQYSYIMLDKEAISDYYYSMLAKVETFRIYFDGDSLATKIR